jgi:hypothetical protein
MTTKIHQSNRRVSRGTTGTEALIRFFLVLLVLTSLSTISPAQRYTVNRPVTSPPTQQRETKPEYIPQHTTPLHWETDYEKAVTKAKQSSQCLLIYLSADSIADVPGKLADVPVIPGCREFSTVILDDDSVREGHSKYVALKLPMNATVTDEEGTEQSIHSLPGFEHMLGLPGLVVIDFAQHDKPYYGEVVGILPFLRGVCPTAKQVTTFLNLPPGTLTQRTLTYAVRIHPDRPLSGDGEPLDIVMQETAAHAQYQAERNVLTHQNFSARSSRVKAVLGSGSPSEICAQCRSGESLFEAALSAMRMWRNSGGHWSIAKRSQTYYGYDMARSKNGTWYAVGFFINQP